jgi:hypothetical protein
MGSWVWIPLITRTPVHCVYCVSCRQQPIWQITLSFKGALAGVCVQSCVSWKSRQRGRLRPSRTAAPQQKQIMFTDEKVKIIKLIRKYFCFRPNVTSFAFVSNIRFSILFLNILNLDSFLKYRGELLYEHKPTCKINYVRLKTYITVYRARKKLECMNSLTTGGFWNISGSNAKKNIKS